MELRIYLTIARKWWWLFLLCVSAAASAGYLISRSSTPIYQSTTTLMVGQSPQAVASSTAGPAANEYLVESYGEMVRRQPVLQATIEAMNLPTLKGAEPITWQELKRQVSVRLFPGTQLIEISVTHTIPEQAQAIAGELARQLIGQAAVKPENGPDAQYKDFARRQLDELQGKISQGEARLSELEPALASAFTDEDVRKIQNEISMLQSQISSWRSDYAQLLNSLDRETSSSSLSVFEPAYLPEAPVQQLNTRQNVLLGALLGLLCAGGIVFLLEYLDDTLRTPEDMTRALGVTTLASIARMKGASTRTRGGAGVGSRLVTQQPGYSPAGEAYRALRSNIQFTTAGQLARTMLFTSPGPVEGKSTTLANTGVVFAQSGLRTLLVDSDLRCPVLHRLFQLPNRVGLTNLLLSPAAERESLEEAIQLTEVENLGVITSGPLPSNPSELLGSARMSEIIAELREVADVVLFDSPPVLAATDATLLTNRLDGTILVIDARRTRRETALRALDQLQRAGAKLLGGVLNCFHDKMQADYYHYYSTAAAGKWNGNHGSSLEEYRANPERRVWWKKRAISKKEA